MTKPIALFDVDNTLYRGFSYFDLVRQQAQDGLVDERLVKDSAIVMQKYKTGSQGYESTLVELLDVYAAALRGKKYMEMLDSAKAFYRNCNNFFDYATPALDALRKTHQIVLVTGEPQFMAEAVAGVLGVKSYRCTDYEVANEAFTGKISRYLASRDEKLAATQELMRVHGHKDSFAFGDSEGDIEMLKAVENPICLNCTDGLRDVAEKEHWNMPHARQVTKLIERLKAV